MDESLYCKNLEMYYFEAVLRLSNVSNSVLGDFALGMDCPHTEEYYSMVHQERARAH